MDFFSILSMIGGLALFLYGMHVMGDGLSKLSGGRLERVLEKLTSTPLRAVLLGAGVTAVIQSSSATTVMVVGFVNSGIMKLSQAIGIIMGANIGTTITSWILSLSGIESSNFFIRLLKPTSFSPVLALAGIILIMAAKKDKYKDVGAILIGFAVLMMGMDMMSMAVKPLADVPEFTGILTMFSNPVLGLLAGALLTAVIQSSSASVGILQALCATGAVSFGTAIPIIMGQNIGTCITAMLSSIGASKNARRAALVHLYFNIIGTVVFMVAFYTVHGIVQFAFLEEAAGAAGIAVVHTVFNVFATLLLIPFSKGLERLAYMTIPEDKEEEIVTEDEALTALDSRFLETPGFAIDQSMRASVHMAELSKQALFSAMELIKEFDEKKMEYVKMAENKVDHYEDQLGSYLVKLSSKHLSEKDSHTLSIMLHCIGDFERISDHAVNIAYAAEEMHRKSLVFSNKATEELAVFGDAVKEIVDRTVAVLADGNEELAQTIEPLEQVIDLINEEVKKRHIKRLRKGKCTIELGFILSDVTTCFERIADHCSNVAVCMLQVNDDNFETHDYLGTLKKSDNAAFQEAMEAFRNMYRLPDGKQGDKVKA